MPTFRLCPLMDVKALIPADCWIAERLATDPAALVDKRVLHITGDIHLPDLTLDAPLAHGSALSTRLQGQNGSSGDATLSTAPYLILVEGHLTIDGALTSDNIDATAHLIVTGNAYAHNAIVGGQLVEVRGAFTVADLLWGGERHHGALRVHGGLKCRIALFTGAYHVHIEGPEQVEFLLDEVRGVENLAEFSSEIAGVVFKPAFLEGTETGADGIGALLSRDRVVAAVRVDDCATCSNDDIHAAFPIANDVCTDNALSAENILSVVRTPVIPHKQFTASGWFQQADFSLCRRHVDEDGDQRDDNVFITVWKVWDFYLSVEQVPARQGLLSRIAATVLRRAVPTTARRTLIYRNYTHGQPGEWRALDEDTAPEAWQACEHAWRGVLDYVRKGVGQHRAHYPLQRRLQAELTAQRIEALTTLPVFTERYNDWWDSDKNGYWEGEIWVGARQPCMHDGEPWGRAIKLSWKNGKDAPGDDEDSSHSAYQIQIDEARYGPAAVEFTYAQRQGDSRATLPACAADHVARLLRFYAAVEGSIRTQPVQDQTRQTVA